MSSLKTNSKKIILGFFLIFSNFWIYKILKLDFLTGLIIIVTSFAIIYYWNQKNAFKILILSTAMLLILQYLKTDPQSLTLLDNDQQRVQQERILVYPPTYIDLYFKVIWLKPKEWIEQNNSIIALSRLEQNLFENLDLNKYFFAGYPRNKPSDFEKFTFFLLPIFFIGLFNLVKQEKYKELTIIFIIPILLMTYIGNKNDLGPFNMFPFFILCFFEGLNLINAKYKNHLLFFCVISLVCIGLLIQFSYAKI